MSEQFKFSDPGEGLQEAEVLEVHVGEGDHVNDGDIVFTVETDKAATDIPASFTGKVEKVHLKPGEVIHVDDVLLTYASEDSDDGEQQGADEQDTEDSPEENTGESKQTAREESNEKERSDDESRGDEEEKEPEDGPESGEDETAEKDQQEKQASEAKSTRKGARQAPVPASPSTRRIARERGVSLQDIEPSGPQGRVTSEDVEAAASSTPQREKGAKQERAGQSSLPDFSRWGETQREPMRSIRRITAERMTQSWQEVPHVYHQDIADVTELERFRHEHAAHAQVNGGKFTLTILVMKALVYALKQFPRFNASLDDQNQEIVLKHYFNIGVAAATERGLLVPVIRDVDRMNLVELTAAVTDIVEKARNGELAREDMQGGCMTLTNPGPLGGTSLSPLINLPEVAILGVGQARLEPVVHGDLDTYEIKPRLLLPLSLGFDHRVNDGADAANFVTTLIGALEDPQSLLLKI